MGYRTIDQVLWIDLLGEGQDPTYEIEDETNPKMDVMYLGMAGELAKDIKCTKITLPMLSTEQYDWKKEFGNALKKAIVVQPQKHVESFTQAYSDFTKEMANEGLLEDGPVGYNSQAPAIWFGSKETLGPLLKQLKFVDGRYYENKCEKHYFVDRCNILLHLPANVIAMIPSAEYFGMLSLNENSKVFNFMFFPSRIRVYRLKELNINHEDTTVHNHVSV